MPECPYCLEQIKAGARKCPHCQTNLETTPDTQSNIIYVVDRGLLRFAKFTGAILAIFILVGAFVFGFDIKEASKNATEAELTIQKALIDIEKKTASIDSKILEVDGKLANIETLDDEIRKHRDDIQKSVQTGKLLILELKQHRSLAVTLVGQIRTLRQGQASVAIVRREEKGILADRGKLWNIGSTVRFHFLDGTESDKRIVRRAIAEWGQYVNLMIIENSSNDSEIRISFKKSGSWSFLGTDALGIPKTDATINYGLLEHFSREKEKFANALHEFGHAIGLVHEFQNPSGGQIINVHEAKKFFSGPPNFWNEDTITEAIFNKDQYPGSREYDPKSIMTSSFPEFLFNPNKTPKPGYELSESDKAYVASLYPSQ